MNSTTNDFSPKVWIQELFAAWNAKDFDQIGRIFENCELYMEDPFYPLQHSIENIVPLWDEIQGQEKLELDYEIMSEAASGVTYRWKATFVAEGKEYDLDGIYFVTFDQEGKCKKFYQWTVEKE